MGNRDPVLKFVVQNRIIIDSKVRFRIIAKSLNVKGITGNGFYVLQWSLNFNI